MKTYNEVKQAVLDYITDGANEDVLINLHNSVCSKENDFDRQIMTEDELFDLYLDGKNAEAVFRAAIFADDSRSSYATFKFWTFNGYGNIVFLSYVDENTYGVNVDHLSDEVAKYWDDLGSEELKEFEDLIKLVDQAIENFNNQ